MLVKLGQDYLTSRPGTAAGVTLGLAVSAGGLLMPLLGLVADHCGPQGVIVVLAAVPVIAILVSAALREPACDPGPQRPPSYDDIAGTQMTGDWLPADTCPSTAPQPRSASTTV